MNTHDFWATATLALAVVTSASVGDTRLRAQSDPAITHWLVNRDGRTGRSTDAAIHAAIRTIPADISRVVYNATDAFVQSDGIPSYSIGPFANPNLPARQNFTFRIPRAPQARGIRSGTMPRTTSTSAGSGIWTSITVASA